MKDKYSILIHEDTSGKTYEYILRKNGEDILMGDGYETINDAKRELSLFRDCLNNVDLELDEEN